MRMFSFPNEPHHRKVVLNAISNDWTKRLEVSLNKNNYIKYIFTVQVSAAREEVPGRRGFPGYMYTDLATIYEVQSPCCLFFKE